MNDVNIALKLSMTLTSRPTATMTRTTKTTMERWEEVWW
jgi:hypothetical protein